MTGIVWLDWLIEKYGWIWVGIAVGVAGKYALLLKKNVKLRTRLMLADLLLLPMVGLIAFVLVKRIGAEAEAAAMIASLCAVLADRLVKVLTERFLQRVDAEAEALAQDMLGRARNVVATEFAGVRVVGDTIEGRAPESYKALEPHPRTPKGKGE